MVEQNLTYAVSLALLGGFFQVLSVLVLAYPEHLKQTTWRDIDGESSSTESLISAASVELDIEKNERKKKKQKSEITVKARASTNELESTANETNEISKGSQMPKKEPNPKTHKPFLLRLNRSILISINVFVQLFNGAATTGAAVFGPVAIVMPVTVSSQLLFNILIFGYLHMEEFDKDVQVGTFIVVLGAVTLTVVGPTIQQDQEIMELLQAPHSLVWTSFLFAGVIMSGISCFTCVHTKRWKERGKAVYVTLAVARVFSSVLSTSLSKALGLVSGFQLFIVIGGFLICGFVLGTSVVLQATKTEQKLFVPAISCLTQLINAATGLILWEDWRVIQSWVGYTAITIQIVTGVYLISSLDFFENTADPYYGMKQSMDLRKNHEQNQNNKKHNSHRNSDINSNQNEVNSMADSINLNLSNRYDHYDIRLRRNNLSTPTSALDMNVDASLHSITSIRGLIGGLKHEPSFKKMRRDMVTITDGFEAFDDDYDEKEGDDELGILYSERGEIMVRNMKLAEEAAKRGDDNFKVDSKRILMSI